MTDIVLDTTTHDLVIENGDIKLFDRVERETVQKVKIKLLVFKGEWFRDIEYGIPYLQSILGKKGTQSIADSFIKEAILSTENIVSLTSYSSTIGTDRKLNVNFSAVTESGDIIDTTIEV